jgi:hypothetical protein
MLEDSKTSFRKAIGLSRTTPPPDLTPQRKRPLELGLHLRPGLRTPALMQHRAKESSQKRSARSARS